MASWNSNKQESSKVIDSSLLSRVEIVPMYLAKSVMLFDVDWVLKSGMTRLWIFVDMGEITR